MAVVFIDRAWKLKVSYYFVVWPTTGVHKSRAQGSYGDWIFYVWRIIFVGPQHGTYSLSLLWRLEFWGRSYESRKLWIPRLLHFCSLREVILSASPTCLWGTIQMQRGSTHLTSRRSRLTNVRRKTGYIHTTFWPFVTAIKWEKVKFILEQATKTQRWSRGIALLFL